MKTKRKPPWGHTSGNGTEKTGCIDGCEYVTIAASEKQAPQIQFDLIDLDFNFVFRDFPIWRIVDIAMHSWEGDRLLLRITKEEVRPVNK